MRAEVLAAVGGFDPGLRRTEDWDLWIRIARNGAAGLRPRAAGGLPFPRRERRHQSVAKWWTRPAAWPNVTASRWTCLRCTGGRPGRRSAADGVCSPCGTTRMRWPAATFARLAVRPLPRFTLRWAPTTVPVCCARDADWIAQAERWLGAFADGAEQSSR